MKRIAYLLFILFSCFIIDSNVYAQEDIAIKSITLDSKSDRVIYTDPEFNGLEFNTTVVFVDVNDYAKFNIVIENNTDKDYTVSADKDFDLSNYVKYRYSAGQIIKHNSTSTISVIFKYTNEVNPSLFNDEFGVYGEENNAVVELVDAQTEEVINPSKDEDIVNPNTGINTNIVLLIVISVILNVIALVFIRNKTLSLVIFVFICLIPSFMYALEGLHITMDVNVLIAKKYRVAYTVPTRNVLLKDDEMDNFDVLTDCKTIYAGSVSEENRYNYCTGRILKYDPNGYIYGDKVKLTLFTFRYFDTNLSGMPINIGNDEYLINESDVSYIKMYESYGWEYRKNIITSYGFTFDRGDKINMELSNIEYDKWNSDGFFLIPNSNEEDVLFTMRNHDTLFVISDLRM